MGFLDKLLGRGKAAAGEAAGDTRMREEGRHQQAAGAASERADAAEESAQAERERAAEHKADQERLNP
jgi:uncharacterized protein YjbJ (UPF0337 family)